MAEKVKNGREVPYRLDINIDEGTYPPIEPDFPPTEPKTSPVDCSPLASPPHQLLSTT
jgi:hypothetical protein